MNEANARNVTDSPVSNRAFSLLVLLFVGSGCSALIYEVVWFQLLRLVLGASALSIGIILACFMGGMTIGSYFFHSQISDRIHPLMVYAFLEIGIALFGVINPVLIPLVGLLYFDIAGYGYVDIALRGLIASIFLAPPTILMGATLPAISRWVQSDKMGKASIGFLYAANIVGAMLGALLAGFYLLRLFDVYIASAVAISINLIIGVIALIMSKKSSLDPGCKENREAITKENANASYGLSIPEKLILLVIALSGFTSLGSQVVWTRLLSLLYGGTVYTFSIIVCIFLLGLAVGSLLGSVLISRSSSSRILLTISQILLVPAICWGCYAINEVIPTIHFFGLEQVRNVTESNWTLKNFNDLLRTLLAIFPATLLWGLSFPLALASLSEKDEDPGKIIGQLYAANTLGAVGGALLFSTVMIVWVGSKGAQQVLMLSAISSFLLMLPALIQESSISTPNRRVVPMVAIAMVFALIPIFLLPPVNKRVIAYGRWERFINLELNYHALHEGINTSVAVTSVPAEEDKYLRLHIGGKVVASNLPSDMNLQRQLGHLPALLHKEPKSVLIIGFGAGVTAGTFTRYKSVERIVIVEIEPSIPLISGEHFKLANYDVAKDPRTEIIIDDGRHYIATTDEKFDIITTDPIHPWVKGAASLYTREFYEHVKTKLNPGGLVTQWIPFYESDESAVKSQIATFFDAFPLATIWNGQPNLAAHDVTLLGSAEPVFVNDTEIIDRLRKNRAVMESLVETNARGFVSFFKLYSGGYEDVSGWMQGAELNLDKNLRLEYLAGASLDVEVASKIYLDMISEINYPEEMFELKPAREKSLRDYFKHINQLMERLRDADRI